MRKGDENIVAVFRNHASLNEGKSAAAGRPIYDDVELCEVRFPGSKNVSGFPATSFSHWEEDPHMGQRTVTYAERFSRQYQQFRAQQQQTKAGTPLDYLPFLTEGKRAELRALNIYTCEALAGVDGQELKNLGIMGRDLKNKAQAFLDEAVDNASVTKLQANMEALAAKNAVLEQDIEVLRQRAESAETQFDAMTDEQLSDYVKSLTNIDLQGKLPRKTLIRMVREMAGSDNDARAS